MVNRRKVDIQKAAQLTQTAGLGIRETARAMQVSPEAIRKSLQTLEGRSLVEKYKDKRADILAEMQAEIINSVNAEDIKQATLLQRITAAGILFDKERLERGQATVIGEHDIRGLIGLITAIPAVDNSPETPVDNSEPIDIG